MSNPSSYFLGSSFVQKPAPASSPSSVAPTFGGIVTLVQNLDGSLQASWLAVTLVPNPPIRYEVYIKQGTSAGLFNVSNLQTITTKLTQKITEDAVGSLLVLGQTYFVGVRAVDAFSNRETNTISLSQTITYANFNTVASAVWDIVRTTRNTPGTFGEALTARVDVDVSTRSSQTSVTAIDTKLGAPATASVSGDIAAVQTKLGTPAGASVSADIATKSSQTSVTAIDTKLGTPATVSVSGDIAAVQTKLGTPATVNIAGDIADVKSDVGNVQTSVNAIPTNPLLANDLRLNNLDATISSRAATADPRFANLDATISSRASQSQVASIQNNTSFVGIVPAPIVLPETGTKTYPIYVRLFNDAGSPADPDSNEIYLEVKNASGSTVVASILMTRSALGQYSYDYVVNSTDTEQALFFFFNYTENSVAFNQVRSTEVVEFESKLDTLLSRLTPTRASNLDNLDTTISSRASQTSLNALSTKIGTPATADVVGDIAAVQTKLGTPAGVSVSADIATRASQTSVTAIDTKLGAPANGSVSADIADVKADVANVPTAAENADAVWDEDVNAHATGTTTARTLKDAKIFSQIDL